MTLLMCDTQINPFCINGIPTEFDTVMSGWSIVYIEGSKVIIFRNILFLSLKIDFGLANSEDPDAMLHNVAFHQGLHCLQKYLFRGFWSTMG